MQSYNAVMSKRGEQVRRNLERLEAEWDQAHPGESMGPVVATRLRAEAWAHERPAKKPTTLREEAEWVAELREAGCDPATLRRPARRASLGLDDLSVEDCFRILPARRTTPHQRRKRGSHRAAGSRRNRGTTRPHTRRGDTAHRADRGRSRRACPD